MRVNSRTSKPKTIKPVKPSAAIEAQFRTAIEKLIDEMHRSLEWWITAAWNKKPPEMAQDESPAAMMRALMKKLTRKWDSKIDKAATELAKYYSTRMCDRVDGQLEKILKENGWAVEFKLTAQQNDVLQATIGQQVSLITKMSSTHLAEIEEIVMRGVQSGGDIGMVQEELRNRYAMTRRRAGLIARDQNNKANAEMLKVRQKSIGINQAIWVHSSAGHKPRPSHVKAGAEKLIYDVDKGAYLDGKWVWPGTEINCIPGTSNIEYAHGCKRLWRRWYTGKLAEIITESGKRIDATPNHPVFTNRGWVAANQVNLGDYIVKVGHKSVNVCKSDIQSAKPSISEIFDALSMFVGVEQASGAKAQFHGDISNGEVDTINIGGFLPDEIDVVVLQEFCELLFTKANHIFITAGLLDTNSTLTASFRILFSASDGVISGLSTLLTLLKSHGGHTDDICDRLIADFNVILKQTLTDISPANSKIVRQFKFADAGLVRGDNETIREFLSIFSNLRPKKTSCANSLSESICSDSKLNSGLFDGNTGFYEFDRIQNVGFREFSGHIYNLENYVNWYTTDTCIIHNCRCFCRPILPSISDD